MRGVWPSELEDLAFGEAHILENSRERPLRLVLCLVAAESLHHWWWPTHLQHPPYHDQIRRHCQASAMRLPSTEGLTSVLYHAVRAGIEEGQSAFITASAFPQHA